MPYYLIHRFGDAKAPQYRKQPFSTEAEAIMRARSLIEAEEQGDFIVEDEEGRVVANDEDIRIPILQTLPTSQVTSPGIGGGGMLPPGAQLTGLPPQAPPHQPSVLFSGALGAGPIAAHPIAGGLTRTIAVPFGGDITIAEPPVPPTGQASVIQRNHASILALARVYERMARDELAKLDSERPNDPETIEGNARERDLLTILADGFAQIAAVLEEFAKDPNQPVFLGRTQAAVNWLSEQLTIWLKANGQDAIGWAIKIPVFVGSLPLLGWAGADMTTATVAIGAMVGGPDVAAALTRRMPKRKK